MDPTMYDVLPEPSPEITAARVDRFGAAVAAYARAATETDHESVAILGMQTAVRQLSALAARGDRRARGRSRGSGGGGPQRACARGRARLRCRGGSTASVAPRGDDER